MIGVLAHLNDIAASAPHAHYFEQQDVELWAVILGELHYLLHLMYAGRAPACGHALPVPLAGRHHSKPYIAHHADPQ